MITYLKNMGRFTYNQLKNRSLEEIQMLYEKKHKWIDDFVPMDSELEVQILKRACQEVLGEEQSAEKEKELSEEELQKLLVVVPVEEVYVEALQVKYPIIDWEKFDIDDLVKLWDLVKERFSITEPTDDKEKELWVKLKRLFELDSDDTLWKLQRPCFATLIFSKRTRYFHAGRERLSIVKRRSNVDIYHNQRRIQATADPWIRVSAALEQ
ncbi:hypothetical protein Tco_0693671 [Tanacetum coccineum]